MRAVWLLAVLQRPGTGKGQVVVSDRWASGQQRAVDASIALTHEQQHYRYGCFAQAFRGLDGLEGLMLAASPVFGARPPGNLMRADISRLRPRPNASGCSVKIAPAAMPQAALDQSRQTPTVHVLALLPFETIDAQGRGAALRTAQAIAAITTICSQIPISSFPPS